jgi:exodeoxyribonuclease VII large subunit
MAINPIKLSELTQHIQRVLSGSFGGKGFWVIGDISNHSYQPNKGYHYFDMVEKEESGQSLKARVNATAWQEGALKILEFEKITGQKFQNDIRILAWVSVEFHPVFGLKLTLMDLDVHYTLGALEIQRQNTLNRLLTECSDFIRKEGDRYITRNKEWKLPLVIQHIAVISSKSSAGFQDFEHTLTHNLMAYRFRIDPYFTQVQGEGNAEGIRNILLDIFKNKIPYDAIFLLRGGGASTDFLLFDTFTLSQIVAKFPIPIITGIGHQKNETLVDLMAHTSTKTPTQAAEFILAHNREFELGMIHLRQGIALRAQKFLAMRNRELNEAQVSFLNRTRTGIQTLNGRLENLKHEILDYARILIQENRQNLWKMGNQMTHLPQRILIGHQNRVDALWLQALAGMKTLIHQENQSIKHIQNLIRVMHPENILKRGFALIKKEGIIKTDIKGLFPGDSLEIILYREELRVTINEKRKRNETDL